MNFEEDTPIRAGPWGGQNGAKWDDGVYNGVRQVVICHGASIDSIQFEYEKMGSSVWSDKHGGTGGIKTNRIKLDYPEEYLVSISGHYGSITDYGQVLIRSLAFESNKKNYGPFGIQHGTHFSFPLSGGKVVGFHGRSSWNLDSIGVHLKPLPQPNPYNNTSTTPSQSHKIPVGKYKGPAKAEANDVGFITGAKDNSTGPTIDTRKPVSSAPWSGNGWPMFDYEVERIKNTVVINNARDILGGPAADPRKPVPIGPWGGRVGYELESLPNMRITDNGIIYGPTTYTRKTPGTWGGNVGAICDYEVGKISNPVDAFTLTKDMNSSGSATSPTKPIAYGPWGGNGGTIFDDGVYAGVREVHITRSGGLVSIQVCYDSNGRAIWGNKNGGSGGFRLDKIAFDYPSEILTHISGYYGSTILGPMVVKSLTFHTNKRKYGPFGEEQGISFTSASNKGRVVGFHGRKGWFIDSIGVHVIEEPAQPSSSLSWISRDSFAISDPKVYEVPPGIVKEPATWACGPWGGNGGKPWDDGVFAGVKSIYLTKGEAIYCIQMEYDRNGQSFWSARHGGGSETSSHMIKLDYPTEVLTGISGYYDSLISGDDTKGIIRSLTFYTNKDKYGPFGEESGTSFPSAKTEGRIVGFHGRSGCYLNSIGVRMQPWPNERDSAAQGPGGRPGGAVKMAIQKFFS